MQTKTKPLTASAMEELDDAHQLEIQILNLKNLGYTMVRSAIPPDMLMEIQNAFDKKMVTAKSLPKGAHDSAWRKMFLYPHFSLLSPRFWAVGPIRPSLVRGLRPRNAPPKNTRRTE